jgi:hypothetical protein
MILVADGGFGSADSLSDRQFVGAVFERQPC